MMIPVLILLLANVPDGRVKELQKERITELRAASEVSMKLAQNGRLEVSEALTDRIALLKAELELAGKPAERIELCRKAVDALKEYEALAQSLREAGRGTMLAVHRAKAKRLEVEIQLERLKADEKDK